MLYVCVLIDLDWAEPMMLFVLHVTFHAFSMHTYLIFNIFDIIDVAWDFSNCSFLFLPLFSIYISHVYGT